MHFRIAFRTLGLLLMMFSISMLPPIFFAWLFADGMAGIFVEAFGYTLGSGLVLWLGFQRFKEEMRIRDGFLVTALFYFALGIFGAMPLMLDGGIEMSIPDALFESFSGLTTTGATVLTGLDNIAPSILYYRQQLQWFGGMGIIVLAVAVLPMLGIGGMQLYRAETPGPMKDTKLTPRIKQTALALWSIYIGLTLACGLAYWGAGMTWFDALCHSFSTIAIGGFSTHDASIGYFNNPLIEVIAIAFMVLSGINFALHYMALRGRSLRIYLRDEEVRFYLTILGISIAIVTVVLASNNTYEGVNALRYAVFQVVSIFTTTGFTTADFANWPNMLPFLVFFGAFTGACAGSTGGGMKVIRVILILKQGRREVHRLIHPHGIFPIKLNKQPVPNKVIEAIWGFFSIYVIIFLFMHLALVALGMDFLTAFSAVGATLNNLGPGLGEVAQHYGGISDGSKLLLSLAMILGRLEIFTLLVLFTPMFWEK